MPLRRSVDLSGGLCSSGVIAAGTPKKLSRKERKAATREHLKETARQCFIDRGFAESTVGSISSRAGVAHGTFYVHFTSKEEVLDELLAEFSTEVAARLAPFVQLDQALETMVTNIAGAFVDALQDNSALLRAFVQRTIRSVSLVELRDGVSPPLTRLLTAALAGVVEQRGHGPEDVPLVTAALLALWFRVGLQYVYNDDVGREQAVKTLTLLSIGSFDAMFPSLNAR